MTTYNQEELKKASKYYIVSYGLGGGFGGAKNQIVEEHFTEGQAYDSARNLAIEDYQSYEGNYGLESVEDIMEELECDYDEAYTEYLERMDSWLDYNVEELTREKALENDPDLEWIDISKEEFLKGETK